MSRAQVTPERIAEIRDRAKANADVRDLLTALEAQQADLQKEERAHLQTVDERDAAQDAADKLAYAIAPIEAIGEHSNLNDPWQNALDELETIKERAEAWGLLNQARELDQQTVARAKERAESAERQLATVTQERDHWKERTSLASSAVESIEAERDALKQERDAALAAHKTDRRELHAIASRYEAALVRIRDNSGDPVVKRIATNALGGEER